MRSSKTTSEKRSSVLSRFLNLDTMPLKAEVASSTLIKTWIILLNQLADVLFLKPS